MEQISYKQRFFEEHPDFKEVKASVASSTIGEFQDIDELEDEVWLMQCPKGMDVAAELEQQKLKLPGRSSFSVTETVAVEYAHVENHAFGYCNRKGRYALRLLPVRGSILLRNRLKLAGELTADAAEALCPPMGRVPMPETIKVRHPLHGHQFDERLKLDGGIVARLRQADEVSAQVLHEARVAKVNNSSTLKRKQLRKSSAPKETVAIQIESGDDEEVEFVSETKVKKKKKKHKHSESVVVENLDVQLVEDGTPKKKKKKKSKDASVEDVSQDLQWLQNL